MCWSCFFFCEKFGKCVKSIHFNFFPPKYDVINAEIPRFTRLFTLGELTCQLATMRHRFIARKICGWHISRILCASTYLFLHTCRCENEYKCLSHLFSFVCIFLTEPRLVKLSLLAVGMFGYPLGWRSTLFEQGVHKTEFFRFFFGRCGSGSHHHWAYPQRRWRSEIDWRVSRQVSSGVHQAGVLLRQWMTSRQFCVLHGSFFISSLKLQQGVRASNLHFQRFKAHQPSKCGKIPDSGDAWSPPRKNPQRLLLRIPGGIILQFISDLVVPLILHPLLVLSWVPNIIYTRHSTGWQNSFREMDHLCLAFIRN